MSLKILVVEDDLPTLELMTEILKQFEVQVHPQSDSEIAAKMVNLERYDGIFLDLTMPKLNGFNLARLIRQGTWNRSSPIVIITANTEKTTMADAFKAGGTFFLQKPVDRRKLKILLNTTRGHMLENRRGSLRVPISADVACRFKSNSFNATSFNVSERGILLEGNGEIQPGDELQLSFLLPGQAAQVCASGLVVRTDEDNKVGINFAALGKKELHSIRDFIAKRVKNDVSDFAFRLERMF